MADRRSWYKTYLLPKNTKLRNRDGSMSGYTDSNGKGWWELYTYKVMYNPANKRFILSQNRISRYK